MSLTSDQTIALRLLESLLLLIPIWLAVTQYIIRNFVKSNDDQVYSSNGYVIVIGFIYSSYLILILSLVGIRSVVSPAIDSANLLLVIDLLILFVLIIILSVVAVIFEQKYNNNNKSKDITEILHRTGKQEDNSSVSSALQILRLYLKQEFWYYSPFLIGILLIVYWMLFGSLILDILAWIIEHMYIEW